LGRREEKKKMPVTRMTSKKNSKKKSHSRKKSTHWRDAAPMTTKERKRMNAKNKECFLDHSTSRPKYPICPKGSAKPSCKGIQSAMARARLQGNTKVLEKATFLDRVLCQNF